MPVFSIAFWGFIALSSIVLFPVAVLVWAFTAPFDRRLRILHLFTCWWASLYSWTNPLWRVRVEGRERIRVLDRATGAERATSEIAPAP